MKTKMMMSLALLALLTSTTTIAEPKNDFQVESILGKVGKVMDVIVDKLPIPESIKGPVKAAVIGHQILPANGAIIGALIVTDIVKDVIKK